MTAKPTNASTSTAPHDAFRRMAHAFTKTLSEDSSDMTYSTAIAMRDCGELLVRSHVELLAALTAAEKSLRLIAIDMADGIQFGSTTAKHVRRDAEEAQIVIAKASGLAVPTTLQELAGCLESNLHYLVEQTVRDPKADLLVAQTRAALAKVKGGA